ncbi:methyltransferase domain-containing protein [Marivita sp. XM-24bin2]|jgi:ubiquinone/menaquinone biosynthesis C-methylase UbiE|uniref:methyltransferase domain-containing protein n=1 Tax=unclassified Marivita TaxID=2632480 RepID=UPI000D7AFD43|nr:methyltransferase domain-containing protein [Marivita sp. XM-24bin2]MCR9111450.1 methyltransferase domain-containing protein [Paracoccaceae bacterium]PWL31318.1 MAG: SAM-dependent methyltransferase [Marivita sp. XM-24bin2]
MADDPYRIADRVDDGMLEMMVSRLEERGRDARFLGMIDDYLDAVGLPEANEVLDLGCGTGVVARRIAGRSGFAGRVLGIDLAPQLVTRARALAASEGLSQATVFEVGDIRSLALEDGRFDVTVMHTLVSHLEDPGAALKEAARVTRAGGAIALFDGDYASSTLETADPDRAGEIDAAMIEATVTQPRVLRRLPRMAAAAGLLVERFFPYVIAEAGRPEFFAGLVDTIGPMLVASGVAQEDEAATIASDLGDAAESGTFFGACNYYGYVLRKP